MPQIELSSVNKSFYVSERPPGRFSAFRGLFRRVKREVRALKDISFSIGEGELVGYIGPNGAGKSTTVKVMGGILTPEKGKCTILGRTPWEDRIHHVSEIGVVFGQRSQLWWDVPVRDSFELLRDVYGVSKEDYKLRLSELAEALDLSSLLETPVRQLSLGQRMRCEIAAALLHRPSILFLDEPTIGLDAVSKLALREFLKAENREHGVTMILTTHDMDDIESLCSRVMTIGHGALLYDGRLSDLKARYAPLHRIRASLTRDCEQAPVPGAKELKVEMGKISLLFDPSITPAPEMISLLASRYPLGDLVVEEQNVDEMIAAMYREMNL